MGSTYASVVVVGTSTDDVVGVLQGESAWVTPAVDGAVVVYAARDEAAIGQGVTARRLSSALDAPVLDSVVFDSDFCVLQLVVGGDVTASIVAPPGAMEGYQEEPDIDPDAGTGMDSDVDPSSFAAAAVAAFGRGDAAAAVQALESDQVFAEEAHAQVLDALGLPVWAAGWGFKYLSQDRPDLPCGPVVRVG